MKKPSRGTWLTAVGAAIAGIAALVLPVLGPAGEAEAAPTGLRVRDGRLYEANGNEFVMRGVNHAHAWYPERTGSLADIAEKGANTVRIVLSTGDRWTRTTADQVSSLIGQCRASKLICVLEAHDTTGYGEEPAAASLDKAADYWVGVKNALVGQEDYVVVNIGNEPFGNNDQSAWTNATKNAIAKLRTAGLRHALMVDAPAWGQDWNHVMRDNAASVLAADPDRNTIFSVHMYGVYDTAAEVQNYLNHFVSNRLPIVVGEFGDNHSDGNPDENAIMATAQSLRVGYLGWSWSGNGGGVEYLDLVTGFDADSLTAWGNRLFHGANGISTTSKTATVYTGGQPAEDTARNGYPYCAPGSTSDPDGDGWGWESSRSCVIRGGSADTAPNGYRYCAQGSASDPDGDGWGWESNRSCVVRHGSADR
ncbi:cellulase family glycosylhydrolase [Streptomyces sp. CB02261]|uniref:cellulase family glycosylhydrolase n=1 Tax=Streptomyces sp. CB02261 TaxID=1703940 RepID=UPI0009390C44|nr:cellulase family glycosylhydrolase [Streptomyces sp. CB02261]OKJ60685.1 beta-mannosidase [Streptomyces sp. CB02261]